MTFFAATRLFAACALLCACTAPPPAAVAPQALPACVGLDGAPAEPNVADGNQGCIRRVERPVLRLLRTRAEHPRGTVLLFPGGGYHILAMDHEGTRTAAFLNARGFDVAILEYTIAAGPGTRDLAQKDALAAWRLLRDRAGAWGLHGQRLCVMGYSAGGHLAARLASVLPEAEQPADVILIYPAYLEETAAGTRVPAVKPPAHPAGRLFALIAGNDRPQWVAGCRAYAAVWKETGGEAQLQVLPDGGHGFGMKEVLPGSAKEWPAKLAAFLDAPPARVNTAVVPAPKLEENGYDWYGRHAQIVQMGRALDPDVVLIGDSITHAWGGLPEAVRFPHNGPKSFEAAFAGHRVLNLGFGWDRTQNVLWRLDHGELDGLHPRAVVIHIGTNNTSQTAHARANTPAEIVEGIEAICGRVRSKVPGVKIILMQVMPREEKPDHPRRAQIAEINRILGEFAKAHQFDLVDLAPKMLRPDGTLPRELMPDFCHPSEAGYQIWGDALRPLLPVPSR